MTKYDALDARTELEQTIAEDLRQALEKRSCTITHHGSSSGHAPGNIPDITISNRHVVITFEVTKSRGASQDREINSIRDHLYNIKKKSGNKKCYCVYVAPETTQRMLDAIYDFNQQRASDKSDLRILPLCFETLELWTAKLRDNVKDLYPLSDFLKLFQNHTEFIDDLRILKLLLQNVFPTDEELAERIEREETERDLRTYETLIKDLSRMEDYMRENGVATGSTAIDTLIY